MHISVLTKSGESVSLTSTINLLFGSKLMDPETGIILNDEMDDFSIPGVSNAFGLEPSPYNYIRKILPIFKYAFVLRSDRTWETTSLL